MVVAKNFRRAFHLGSLTIHRGVHISCVFGHLVLLSRKYTGPILILFPQLLNGIHVYVKLALYVVYTWKIDTTIQSLHPPLARVIIPQPRSGPRVWFHIETIVEHWNLVKVFLLVFIQLKLLRFKLLSPLVGDVHDRRIYRFALYVIPYNLREK